MLCAPAFAADLPALHADITAITVSGVSSGASMAVQFHVAHSATVKGAGAIAGTPYYCAMGSLWAAYYNCLSPGIWTPLPSVEVLAAATEAFAKGGRIDATQNLAAAPVWLFSGTRDSTVAPAVVAELKRFYERFGATPVLIADRPAGHAMVTQNAGNKDCGVTAPPYINDCDYDAAGELLRHLLGKLNAAAAKDSGRLLLFSQPENSYDLSLADNGYVYIPKECESQRCRVHVAFHGCRQGAAEIGERFVREAGYNRWADANRLIVLYPQARVRYGWSVFNPRGCWDWWGYTGAGYATREGGQIRAVRAMLERLSAPRQ